jgi:ketosteroid isomerase-like protein
MYKTIVKWRLRKLFAAFSAGDYQPIIDGLAPTFKYTFIGQSPLSGTRTKHASMQLWFQRLLTLFPGARLEPQDILVAGPPWNTRIMTYVKFRALIPGDNGGSLVPYENEVMQLIDLRWGRMTSVFTLEDTQRFANILPRLKAAGIAHTDAPPIED